ncbi:MAG: segregation and condensation protein A [Pyrinomonadaceae bacterium]
MEAEEVDPRAELVRRLLEYEQIKLAALRLDQLPQAERDFALIEIRIEQEIIKRLPEVVAEDLRNAWQELLNRVELNRHHRVTREQLSVREHMTRILRCLQERKLVEFGELFDVAGGVPELVVTFLALLELARENLLRVAQQKAYGPIYVKQSETNGTSD